MALRKKNEVVPTLKADDFKAGDTVIATAIVNDIKDVETKQYGLKTVIVLENQQDNVKQQVFLNNYSMSNLIDAYGEDDTNWRNKFVSVECQKDKDFNKKMLVVKAI